MVRFTCLGDLSWSCPYKLFKSVAKAGRTLIGLSVMKELLSALCAPLVIAPMVTCPFGNLAPWASPALDRPEPF